MATTGSRRTQDDSINETTPLLVLFEAHSRVADWLATVGVMGVVFSSATNWRDYLPRREQFLSPEAWVQAGIGFVEDNGWPPFLAATAFAVYVAGRVFARKNIGQLRSMFADSNTPTGYQIITAWHFLAMVYGQLLLILFMIAFSSYIIIPALGWIALHSLYIHSNLQQAAWMSVILASQKHKPPIEHRHYDFFMDRRAAALEYTKHRHNWRECLVIGGSFIAIGLHLAETKWGLVHGKRSAYIVLISIVLLNEAIVYFWRRELHLRFKAANIRQFISDRRADL